MTKLNKLKMFNILVFALIPILIVAMVTTITLAAMTTGGYGQNVINIGKLGTVECTAVASTTGVYPGGSASATLTFKYTPEGSYNASAVTVSNFKVTQVKIMSGTTTMATLNESNGKFGPISNITCTLPTSIAKGNTATATLSFSVGPGAVDAHSSEDSDPSNYLVNSATSIVITFTLNVDPANNATYS